MAPKKKRKAKDAPAEKASTALVHVPRPIEEKRTGRPSSFTEELGDRICERMIDGESLRSICRDEEMPSPSMVFRWIEQNEHFREQYARAREIQLELISDEIIEIADTSRIGERRRSGFGPQGAISEVTTVDVVERSKLQVDARKWVLARLMPKKYGDKPQEKTSKANEQMQALRDILIAGPVEETPDTEPES